MLLSAAIPLGLRAADPADTEAVPSAFRAHPGSVAELRNQDAAFSLLIESYRQMQTFMIEADFEKRLRAAALVKDNKDRDHIIDLAGQEHDLRLAQLRENLGKFNATYDTSRQSTEKATGVSVPNKVDTKTADAKLRKLVPFTPSKLGPSQDHPSQLLPAGAQMIYSRRP